ncbi:O-antigen ligase family protein [Alteromonas sp. SM 2104]|nr:O-antigen ligase family protein [Alteromonas oceanisediminis]
MAFFFLFLYTALVFIRPQEIFVALNNIPVIQFSAILCLLGVLAGQRPLRWGPQQGMLLAMLPVVAISGILNGWGTGGIMEAQSMLIATNIPLFLYVTVVSTVSRQTKLMALSILASVLMIHNGYMQTVNVFGWSGTPAIFLRYANEVRIRYLGFFNDPNDLGMLIVMNIAFVFYFYGKAKFLGKLICLGILAWFGYGIYLTGSRGTILGAAAVIGLYLLFKYGGTRLIIAAVVAGPMLATLMSKFGGLGSDDSSANSRLEAWYDGIHYLIGNPIWGIGKGNFTDWHGRAAHNSYILVASELGIIGYTLWGGALTVTMLAGFKIFKMKTEQFDDHPKREAIIAEMKVNTALFFAMVGFVVTAFFLSRSYTLLMYIFLGMMVASLYRMVALVPELKSIFSMKNVAMCSMYSWVMVIMVYITLKVAL